MDENRNFYVHKYTKEIFDNCILDKQLKDLKLDKTEMKDGYIIWYRKCMINLKRVKIYTISNKKFNQMKFHQFKKYQHINMYSTLQELRNSKLLKIHIQEYD